MRQKPHSNVRLSSEALDLLESLPAWVRRSEFVGWAILGHPFPLHPLESKRPQRDKNDPRVERNSARVIAAAERLRGAIQ